MSWFILVIAGLLEVVWALGLKASEGFTRFYPSVITLVALALSFLLLGLAMKTLPVSVAYPVWVGIGAIGAVIAGIFWFGEAASVLKLCSVLLIAAGIIGLKLSST